MHQVLRVRIAFRWSQPSCNERLCRHSLRQTRFLQTPCHSGGKRSDIDIRSPRAARTRKWSAGG